MKAELLIALLSENGFEGFETKEGELLAYIPESDFDEKQLRALLQEQEVSADITDVGMKNWNEEWESNFQPVIVEDFCTVRADFHDMEVKTPYEIVITPKMSFGTGHHATTQLMMEAMKYLDFNGKAVLDFGTGTGILAILASKLNAKHITGVDNEDWAWENAQENTMRNHTDNVAVRLGSLVQVPETGFDILLANINRHILLEYMAMMAGKLNTGGTLLLSGILKSDEDILKQAVEAEGLKWKRTNVKGDWIMMQIQK